MWWLSSRVCSLSTPLRAASWYRASLLIGSTCASVSTQEHLESFSFGRILCRNLCTAGVPACFPLRTCQHHGCHAPPLKHSPHSCAAHAEPFISGVGSAGAFQYQSNGCADQAVVHHGGCECGRTIRSSGNNGRSTDDRRRH